MSESNCANPDCSNKVLVDIQRRLLESNQASIDRLERQVLSLQDEIARIKGPIIDAYNAMIR